MRGVLGIAVILLLAWALSENRTRVPWRVVTVGVLLQLALAFLFLRFPPARAVFLVLNRAVEALQNATEAGTGFVFGYLGGGQLPFAETQPGASFIFAFRALPLVLVISALATLLFYWGVLQRIVQAFAWVLRWAVGIGGPLGLGAAVHIFVGHIEAPLLIRPYLMRLARGELFALMSCGMAGIAGTVMVLYAALVGSVIPNALGNILIAAVISTPAALAIAALMIPFRPDPSPTAQLVIQDPPVSSMDAVAKGTRDGIVFLANIIAMLVVTIALVSLVNAALGQMMSLEVRLPGDLFTRRLRTALFAGVGARCSGARAGGSPAPRILQRLSVRFAQGNGRGDGLRLGRPRRLDLPDPTRGARKRSGALTAGLG